MDSDSSGSQKRTNLKVCPYFSLLPTEGGLEHPLQPMPRVDASGYQSTTLRVAFP